MRGEGGRYVGNARVEDVEDVEDVEEENEDEEEENVVGCEG